MRFPLHHQARLYLAKTPVQYASPDGRLLIISGPMAGFETIVFRLAVADGDKVPFPNIQADKCFAVPDPFNAANLLFQEL